MFRSIAEHFHLDIPLGLPSDRYPRIFPSSKHKTADISPYYFDDRDVWKYLTISLTDSYSLLSIT